MNYTGPYISDGKFQTSVAFGKTQPANELDRLSRLHDTAYSVYTDPSYLMAADAMYADEAGKLEGKLPAVAATAVKQGNMAINGFNRLGKNVLTFGPLGLIKTAVENIWDASHYIDNEKSIKKNIKHMYNSDPVTFPILTDEGVKVAHGDKEYENILNIASKNEREHNGLKNSKVARKGNSVIADAVQPYLPYVSLRKNVPKRKHKKRNNKH